jgi:hypothetical protein
MSCCGDKSGEKSGSGCTRCGACGAFGCLARIAAAILVVWGLAYFANGLLKVLVSGADYPLWFSVKFLAWRLGPAALAVLIGTLGARKCCGCCGGCGCGCCAEKSAPKPAEKA